MTEYVTREAATQAAVRTVWLGQTSNSQIAKAINDVPAADVVKVVHGVWVEKPFLMGISRFCSKCGDNFGMPHGVYRYCPTCGAKMDLEVTDNG